MTTIIIGSYPSPYVRKVLVALALKGVPYTIDPLVPFFGNDAFDAISPIRRIPVLLDDAVTISDSTVIAEYLDERYPSPPLLPYAPADRARARWLEEFADTRMGDVFIWKLFNQRVIGRIWGREPDEAVVAHALDTDMPMVLDYLEREAPAEGFAFGTAPMLADIAVAAFFRNAALARYTPDAARWPRALAWVGRTLALPAYKALEPFELLSLKTPVAEHRAALAAAGAPISQQSWIGARPRPGVMPI